MTILNKTYIHYHNPTREVFDTIKVGDLVKVNAWTKPMRVKAVSENYFVMTMRQFKNTYYSVCSKLPWHGVRHNEMTGGMFHCGPDDLIFGSPLCISYENVYEFTDDEVSRQYLQAFEDEEAHISERKGVPIYDLYIKTS